MFAKSLQGGIQGVPAKNGGYLDKLPSSITISLFPKRLKHPCTLVEGIPAFNGSPINKRLSAPETRHA